MGIQVIAGPRLRIQCTGAERLLSFFTVVDVPIQAVKAVRITSHQRPAGPRLLGTGIPWFVALGRYKGAEGPEFWRVYRGSRLLDITLEDAPYRRAVLQASNVDELAETVQTARRAFAP